MRAKLIKESISFERGGDPKKILDIGMYNYFENHLPGLKKACECFVEFDIVGYYEDPKHRGVYTFLINFPEDGNEPNGLCSYDSLKQDWAYINFDDEWNHREGPGTFQFHHTTFDKVMKKYDFIII